MNNQEQYKNELNNIHPNEELVNNTIKKAVENVDKKKNSKLKNIIPYTIASLSACAAIMILVFNVFPLKPTEPTIVATSNDKGETENKEISDFIKPFSSQEELNKKVKELHDKHGSTYWYDDLAIAEVDINEEVKSESNSEIKSQSNSNDESSSNYSKTNVQVDGVDEADIIKTDGNNIYVCNMHALVVLDKNLKLVNDDYNDVDTYVEELYLTSDKIVLIATGYNENTSLFDEENSNRYYTHAIVIDKKTYKEIRKVSLNGLYVDSRLIGDNLYFITNTALDIVYDTECKTPTCIDTAVDNKEKSIVYSDVYCVDGYDVANYTNICAFNIGDDAEAKYKSFFGFRPTIYCSEKNIYFIHNSGVYDSKIDIIKMSIDGVKMNFVAETTLFGTINDQFSVDEYKGNLRVATTETEYFEGATWIRNHLYILDEKLNVIGKTKDYGTQEKIYAVRFIGDVGYVVTFKEIDPLYIMDLSDPTNPRIRGELKVPGYSAYLHPYDENHIIGIGYNVETSGSGRLLREESLKVSMFDVSDLDNPKELYSTSVSTGSFYTTSRVLENHKALLYDKERSLIGFPVNSSLKDGFVIYKIEKDGFKEIASNYNDKFVSVQRVIYIEDTLYELKYMEITSYDMNTMEKENEYVFEKYITNDIKNDYTEVTEVTEVESD